MKNELTLNKELNGLEMRFDEKPSEEVRKALLTLGFRFTNKDDDARWYVKLDKAQDKAQDKKAKAKKTEQVELGDLGTRGDVRVVIDGKIANRKGFTFSAKVGETEIELIAVKLSHDKWNIAKAETGELIGKTVEHRYLALEQVTASFVKKNA